MQALACAAAGGGLALAQPADLPNANLPGNSASLPNSNLPGPVPTDAPISLPNTDTSWQAWNERRMILEQQAAVQRDIEVRNETMRLAARAAEESALARADAAEARQTLANAVEQAQAREAQLQQALQQQQQQQGQPQEQAQPQAAPPQQ